MTSELYSEVEIKPIIVRHTAFELVCDKDARTANIMSYSRKPLNLKELKIKHKRSEQLGIGAFGYTLFSDTGALGGFVESIG